MKLRPRRGMYANVAATLALMLALGGIAYAANTVGSKDIINHSIKRIDIANRAQQRIMGRVVAGYKDDGGSVTGSAMTTVGTLSVPRGTWAVVAKAYLDNNAADALVQCRLHSTDSYDDVWQRVGASGATDETDALAFTLVTHLSSPSNVTLGCNPHGGNVHVYWIKISAIEVGSFSNTGL